MVTIVPIPVAYNQFTVPTHQPPNSAGYMSGGCKMQLGIGINFTGSNSNPCQPGALRHIDPNEQNDMRKLFQPLKIYSLTTIRTENFQFWAREPSITGYSKICFNVVLLRKLMVFQGLLKLIITHLHLV